MASVKVAVRIRPLNTREMDLSSSSVVSVVDGKQIVVEQSLLSSTTSGGVMTMSSPSALQNISSRDERRHRLSSSGLHRKHNRNGGISHSPSVGTGGHGAMNTSFLNTSNPCSDGSQHKFTFDFAYSDDSSSTQEQVYNDLGVDVVENAYEGYNACVFAYGQTGSGKTFTMMGQSDCDEMKGLIPRICKAMFDRQHSRRNSIDSLFSDISYRTEVSYLEIYNERVKDLLRTANLSPSHHHQSNTTDKTSANSQHNLKVREHPSEGPYVENLSKHLVLNYEQIFHLMNVGNGVRTTASTKMNDTSSRSHAIFTLNFVKAGVMDDGEPHETVSKIHLVDLAGSERCDATGSTGQRLKEGGHINKSLVTLGSVISALADISSSSSNKHKSGFIPYRDSVLTWLLKDSLGGNSKTIMIATISPAEINQSETLSTLRYANRAKNIINKPHINEDPNVKLIRDLREEIKRLKEQFDKETAEAMESVADREKSKCKQKLESKEAQERHLTHVWNNKWKEVANILQESETVDLKRCGHQGIVLDSNKPHLIGIDEDVMSTGITLYHLNENEPTVIGSSNNPEASIQLRGSDIQHLHCTIHSSPNGVCQEITLEPGDQSATCYVNGNLVFFGSSQPLRHGSVVVLGKSHMFRYNDPRHVATILKNTQLDESNTTANLPLMENNTCLSTPPVSDCCGTQRNFERRESTPVTLTQMYTSTPNLTTHFNSNTKQSDIVTSSNISTNTTITDDDESCSHESYSCKNKSSEGQSAVGVESSITTTATLSCISEDQEVGKQCREGLTSSSTDDENGTSSAVLFQGGDVNDESIIVSSSGENINTLYRKLVKHKEIIMSCLDNDTCDIHTLNVEIRKFQRVQRAYNAAYESIAEGVAADADHQLVPVPGTNRPRLQEGSTDGQQGDGITSNVGSDDSSTADCGTENTLEEGQFLSGDKILETVHNDIAADDVHEIKKEKDELFMVKERQAAEIYRLKEELNNMMLWKNHSAEGEDNDNTETSVKERLRRPKSLRLCKKSNLDTLPYPIHISIPSYNVINNDHVEFKLAVTCPPPQTPSLPNSPAILPTEDQNGNVVKHTLSQEECRRNSDELAIKATNDGIANSSSTSRHTVVSSANENTFTIVRRFRQFRELHVSLCKHPVYGSRVRDIYFPPRRLFGNMSDKVCQTRQMQLQAYINSVIQVCANLDGPLRRCQPSIPTLLEFAPDFFGDRNSNWSM